MQKANVRRRTQTSMDSDDIKLIGGALLGLYLFQKLEVGKVLGGVNAVVGAVGQTTGAIGSNLTLATTRYTPITGGNQLLSFVGSVNPFTTWLNPIYDHFFPQGDV